MSEMPRRPKTKTSPWDPAEDLHSDAEIIAYLNAALEDGDAAVIALAVGDVARARGMTAVAAEAKLGRESLYKSLSFNGNPAFSTVMRVLGALGLRLRVQTAKQTRTPSKKHVERRMIPERPAATGAAGQSKRPRRAAR